MGLIHSPALLFLDVPSTGLDPQSRANLWQHILRLRETFGTTVFVTTQYLEEADQFAERVLVMDHGRVIADDGAAALKSRLAGTTGSNLLFEMQSGSHGRTLNPVSSVVSAERALFAGDLASPKVLSGFVAAIALAAVGLAVGIRAIRRSH